MSFKLDGVYIIGLYLHMRIIEKTPTLLILEQNKVNNESTAYALTGLFYLIVLIQLLLGYPGDFGYYFCAFVSVVIIISSFMGSTNTILLSCKFNKEERFFQISYGNFMKSKTTDYSLDHIKEIEVNEDALYRKDLYIVLDSEERIRLSYDAFGFDSNMVLSDEINAFLGLG